MQRRTHPAHPAALEHEGERRAVVARARSAAARAARPEQVEDRVRYARTSPRPRSRPMISFMISFEPAQIFVTRASIHAWATSYSSM